MYGTGRGVETQTGNAIEVVSSHAEHFTHRAGGDLLMVGWVYMGCILKSKKPPEMLVMRPTKSELVMNVKGGRNDENSG